VFCPAIVPTIETRTPGNVRPTTTMKKNKKEIVTLPVARIRYRLVRARAISYLLISAVSRKCATAVYAVYRNADHDLRPLWVFFGSAGRGDISPRRPFTDVVLTGLLVRTRARIKNRNAVVISRTTYCAHARLPPVVSVFVKVTRVCLGQDTGASTYSCTSIWHSFALSTLTPMFRNFLTYAFRSRS